MPNPNPALMRALLSTFFLTSVLLLVPNAAHSDGASTPTLDARFSQAEIVVIGEVGTIEDTSDFGGPIGPILKIEVGSEEVFKGSPDDEVAVLPVFPSTPEDFELGEQIPLYLFEPVPGSPAEHILLKTGHEDGLVLRHETRWITQTISGHKAILEILANGQPMDLFDVHEPAARQAAVHWVKDFTQQEMEAVLVQARDLQETTNEILEIIATSRVAFPEPDERAQFLGGLRFETESPSALHALYAEIQISSTGDDLIFADLIHPRPVNRAAAARQADQSEHPDILPALVQHLPRPPRRETPDYLRGATAAAGGRPWQLERAMEYVGVVGSRMKRRRRWCAMQSVRASVRQQGSMAFMPAM